MLSAPTNLVAESSENSNEGTGEELPPTSPGIEIGIKFRLSTNKDIKLIVRTTDTILHVKRRIESLEGVSVLRQKFLFGGKVLADKTRFADVRLARGAVIQVAVSAAV